LVRRPSCVGEHSYLLILVSYEASLVLSREIVCQKLKAVEQG